MDIQIVSALIAYALVVAAAGAVGLAAARWGVDSRPGLGDDHRR